MKRNLRNEKGRVGSIDHFAFDRYRDISFLRLMEAFLEAAAQSVLQLYILTRTTTRPRQEHFQRLSWGAYFVILFWHLSMIFGRQISLALFASVYGRYIFVVFCTALVDDGILCLQAKHSCLHH